MILLYSFVSSKTECIWEKSQDAHQELEMSRSNKYRRLIIWEEFQTDEKKMKYERALE